MAWTVTYDKKTVFGDERVLHMTVTTDGGSEAIDTGLESINGIAFTPASLTSTTLNIHKNVLTAATAAPGYVSVTGATSGDDFYLTVFGR